MLNLAIERHLGLQALSKDHGITFVCEKHKRKDLRASDFDRKRLAQQIRVACCDAVHRFGKTSGSTK
jgi:hypothetical protein